MRNLTGQQFGTLTVLEKLSERDENGRTRWKCICLCGDYRIAVTHRFSGSRALQSCGKCEWHIKHKEAYTSWCAMKQRCNDSNRKDYPDYGGRGISYDSRWEDFVEFYKDMGDPPMDSLTYERLSLDRIENDLNYSKNNCKWSNRSQQQLNKRPYIGN